MSERLTFPRVLRSEWTKLVSLRSTWYSLAGVVVLTVGLAGVIGHALAGAVASGDQQPPDVAEAVSAAFLPLDFLVLVLGVLGVLQMAGEYQAGSVRITLAAVPRRWPVLCAKALAFAALTLPVMGVTALASFLVSQAFLGDHGVSLGEPGIPGKLVGAAACPVLLGLFGMGVGALLRHTALGVTTLVAVLFVIPVLMQPALPGDLEDDVLKFVPTVAGQAMYGSLGADAPFPTLSPGVSALVLVGWVGVLLAAGAALLVRRDA
jgi:ABC-2 type transport system permease protein